METLVVLLPGAPARHAWLALLLILALVLVVAGWRYLARRARTSWFDRGARPLAPPRSAEDVRRLVTVDPLDHRGEGRLLADPAALLRDLLVGLLLLWLLLGLAALLLAPVGGEALLLQRPGETLAVETRPGAPPWPLLAALLAAAVAATAVWAGRARAETRRRRAAAALQALLARLIADVDCVARADDCCPPDAARWARIGRDLAAFELAIDAAAVDQRSLLALLRRGLGRERPTVDAELLASLQAPGRDRPELLCLWVERLAAALLARERAR